MSDNNPSSNKRKKKKWKRKKDRQETIQNNNVTSTHQHENEPYSNGADFTSACPTTIKVEFFPCVRSHQASGGSPSHTTAGMSQLQTGRTSVMMHRTVVKLDNDPKSHNRKKRWKMKKKRQDSKQNSSDSMMTGHQEKTHYNGAFAPHRTVMYQPRLSSEHSSEGSSSQSTACTYNLTHPQVHSSSKTQPNCEPTTSTHKPPPSAASEGPANREGISSHSKTLFSGSVVGPSKQSSLQRTFSSTQLSVIPSKYLAIDCEMVGAGPKGHISQLARCSIVSYDGDVVYDKFIKPGMAVTDYRTPWSGIRARDLYGATPYAEARKEILKLVRGKVLIGHAIHNDLKVLSYCHPKDMTRDTSRIPLLNVKAGFNEKEVVSLKRFTKALFNRDIQAGRKGHSSVEDAKATMELYKVVEVEWERTLASTAQAHQSENK